MRQVCDFKTILLARASFFHNDRWYLCGSVAMSSIPCKFGLSAQEIVLAIGFDQKFHQNYALHVALTNATVHSFGHSKLKLVFIFKFGDVRGRGGGKGATI